jgi:hypothetical protein
MKMKNGLLALLLGALPWTLAHASFCTTYIANGGPGACITASGMSNQTAGVTLAASVVFEANAGNLDVLLLNDGTPGSIVNQGDFLTGLAFSLSVGNLTADLASLHPGLLTAANNLALGGDAIVNTPDGHTIGEENGFGTTSAYGFGSQDAISNSGSMGFNTPNFCQTGFGSGAGGACSLPGNGLDGPPWGFVTKGGSGSGGNSTPNVKYYGFYTLTGLGNVSNALLRSSLSHITFQYGTDTSETHFAGGCVNCSSVPEPSYLFLLGPVLLALVFWRLSTRRRVEA